MKTYRFVFLLAIMSVLSILTHASNVTTVVNAQIYLDGEKISDRYIRSVYNNLKVVAYVDGKECGRQETPELVPALTFSVFYFPVSVTTDEANLGKPIEMHVIVNAPENDGSWSSTAFAKVGDGEYIIRDVALPSNESELIVKNGTYGSPEKQSFVTLNFVPPSVTLPESISVNVGKTVDLLSKLSYTPQNASIPYNPSIKWDFANSADYITIKGNTLIAGEKETEEWGAWFGGSFEGFDLYVSSTAFISDPSLCKVYAMLWIDGEEVNWNNYGNYGLSAYVNGEKVAGPDSIGFLPTGGLGPVLLKIKDAPKGNIEFRVSSKAWGIESYSTSEYIIQKASLVNDVGETTVFPFVGAKTYGSQKNPVNVYLVTPTNVALTPEEITAYVDTPVSFSKTFDVSFLSDSGEPASIPSSYTAAWNVGNYVSFFTVSGDELTANQTFEKPLTIGAQISNKELGLSLFARINVTIEAKVVPVTNIAITKGNESHSLWVGERLGLTSKLYKISPEDATDQSVEWTSSDETIVKINYQATNNSFSAEALKPGKVTLTVTTKDGGKKAKMTVEVKRHVESFSLTASSLTMDKGATRLLDELVKEVLPSDASDKRIGWRLTQGETGLTLLENDGKWYVTADAVGSYTLTAYSVENSQLTQRLSVTVNAVVNGITVTSPVQSVYPGGAIDLGYKVDSSDPVSVEWTSSAPSVVSVVRGNDGKWVATALKAGSATLTVKTIPGDKTATISVTVWSHVESLSLTEQSLSLTKGQSAVLDGYVKLSPESAHNKTVRWTTSDTSVATVSESNGVWSVTAVGGGEASLKVTSVDNEKASASLTVKVTVPVTGIAIKEQFMSQTLWIGDNPLVLTSDMYVITPSDASDVSVTWSSADASVVSLSRDATGSSWTATAKTVGKTTLTVTTVDGDKSAQMTVEVKRHVESFSLIVSSLTMDKGATRSLDELVRDVLPSDASDKRIGWRLTQGETGLTLLESDGKWYVTADAVGSYTLTAYSVENPQLTQRLSVTVNAVVGGITVTSPVQSVYPGDAIDLGYKVDSNDAVSVEWTSSAPSVVSVARGNDGKWVATALKAGSATLTVKTIPGDKTATISVTVWSHVESLTLTEQILILEKGMTTVVDRYVRFMPEDVYDKRLRWTSSEESVAYLYESGGYWSVNALSKGEATLTVTSVENPEATATMIVRVIIPLEGVVAVNPIQTVEVGEKVDLSCTFTPSDATDISMTWTSSDDAVVEVSVTNDGSWMAVAKGFGTATLTGKSNDGGLTTSITVTVPYRVTEIILSTSSISLKPSETFNPDSYVQAVLPEQATDKSLTWETSDANIVKLEGQSGAYTATAVGVGEATLTVRSNDVSKTHVIEMASIATTGWIINSQGKWQDATSLGNYASKIIDVSSYVGKNYSFTSSSATSYAFVTSYPVSGQVPSYAGSATGISWGTSFNGIIPSNASYLYILTNNGGNVRVPSDITIKAPNVTATMTVTVIEDVIPLTDLAFVSPSQAVYSGETVDVTWTPTPANANSYSVQLKFDEKVFEYKSNVMTVRLGVAAGDYTITAQAYDAEKKELNVRATLTVNVRTHVSGLTISDILGDNPLSVAKDASVILDNYVIVIPADAYNKSLTWKSSDTSVATVSEKDGVWSVTGVALGETSLTVTSKDNPDVSATLKVRVVEGIIPVTDFTFIDNVRMTKGDVETIVLTPIPENATVDITKFSVIIADIYSQGNDWRYLDVAIEEKNERIEAIISNAYTWGINSFDIYYDGKKMGSVSVNVGAAMPFAKDWTWISTPSADYAANKLNAIGLDDMGKTFDTSLQEVRGESVLLYNDAELGYFGDFEGLTSTTMYKFNFTKKPGPFIIYNINRNIVTFTVHPGWNWVAYPYEYAYTLDELTKAKVFASAEEGDRIAVQDVFVEFSDEKWSGVLTSLQPSEGFMYYRKSDSDATIAWAGYDVLGQKLSAQGQQANGRRSASAIWDYNAHAFADNMTIVATIDGVDFPEDCTVGAFVNGECRGRGEYVDGRYFITVHGAAGESVSFVLYDEQTQTYWTVLGSLSFSDKAGSVKNPIHLKTGGQTTQIVILQAGYKLETPVFDLQGRRVAEPVKGIYIINGEKIIK